jgi:hypothetical protein
MLDKSHEMEVSGLQWTGNFHVILFVHPMTMMMMIEEIVKPSVIVQQRLQGMYIHI